MDDKALRAEVEWRNEKLKDGKPMTEEDLNFWTSMGRPLAPDETIGSLKKATKKQSEK